MLRTLSSRSGRVAWPALASALACALPGLPSESPPEVILEPTVVALGPETAVTAPPTAVPTAPAAAQGQVWLQQPFAIIVAYTGPQTGTGSALFTPMQQAAQKAIDDHGPVHGYGVNLIAFNDFCTQEGGAAAAQQIVADERIVAVIGPVCSVAATGALPILESAGVVMVSGGTTAPGLSVHGPTVFHRAILDDDQVKALGHPSQIYVENFPAVQAWLADFEAGGGVLLETGLNHYTPYQYDAMNVLLRALDLSSQPHNDGSLLIDRAALRAMVRATTNYPGVTGYITFEDDGDRAP
jgi:ABC-type branched-subunit amino acid transport system substrate-binding protein